MNLSGLFQCTASKHIRQKICLLSIPCFSNAIFLLYLYSFLFFASQTIEYYVMFFAFHFRERCRLNNFIRSPTLFSLHILRIFAFEFVQVHLINLIVQLYFRFILISGFQAFKLLCHFSPAEFFFFEYHKHFFRLDCLPADSTTSINFAVF